MLLFLCVLFVICVIWWWLRFVLVVVRFGCWWCVCCVCCWLGCRYWNCWLLFLFVRLCRKCVSVCLNCCMNWFWLMMCRLLCCCVNVVWLSLICFVCCWWCVGFMSVFFFLNRVCLLIFFIVGLFVCCRLYFWFWVCCMVICWLKRMVSWLMKFIVVLCRNCVSLRVYLLRWCCWNFMNWWVILMCVSCLMFLLISVLNGG